MAYFKLGKAAQGLPDAEKSLELRPNDPFTFNIRGHIFEALGRKEEAIADYRQALAIMPALEDASRGLQRLGDKTGMGASEKPSSHERDIIPLDCRNYVPSAGLTIAVPCDP